MHYQRTLQSPIEISAKTIEKHIRIVPNAE